jgi:AraC-like DNA-binding protein
MGRALDIGDELIALELSSSEFADRERTEAFHQIYGREILKLEIEPLPDTALQIDMKLRALPGMSVAAASVSPIFCRHTEAMIDNDDPVLVFNLDGTAIHNQNGHETCLGPGEAVLTTNGLPGTATNPTWRRVVTWRISRALIAPLVRNFDDAIGRPLGKGNPALSLFLDYLGIVNERQTLANAAMRRAVVNHMIDLGALVLGATPDALELANTRGVAAARMRSIKAHIRAQFGNPGFSLDSVAAKQGISKSYVRRLFEAEGTSFTEFVRNQRLASAYKMLTDPSLAGRSISEIAHQSGFNDISYFNRSFRRVYGASPSDIRVRK